MKYLKLILSLLIAFIPGIIGSYFTISQIPTWYALLDKPFFNPPNWIFGPVWTILYIVLGIYLYKVWQKGNNKENHNELVLIMYFLNLIINGLWTIIFFGAHQILASLIIILLLIINTLTLIVITWKKNIVLSLMLLPYILWLGFATVLNYFILILNK